ncbi:MAG: metal-dependent transcriptional regulator [Candidatus Thermoplasmatota archaeon]|nr:metal-dependent transcriptional regulator [Candidatus Thermoplasmatota archaeon]
MTDSKYLKEVYRAYEKGVPLVGPTYLGKVVGVNKATAYQSLQKLARMNYGTYIKNKGFVVNNRGKENARILIRRHRLLECLIVDTLGLSPCEACREAGNIDTFMGKHFDMALERKYSDRHLCPCGNEIPSR